MPFPLFGKCLLFTRRASSIIFLRCQPGNNWEIIMKLTLHHINLSTTNVEVMDDFYQDVLGLDRETEGLPVLEKTQGCLLYTSPSPRDMRRSRMPSSA